VKNNNGLPRHASWKTRRQAWKKLASHAASDVSKHSNAQQLKELNQNLAGAGLGSQQRV